jgi:flagellar basal-body rod protein FlgC
MSSVFPIATSGMLAAGARLDVAASNTANILTTGPVPTSGGGSTTANSAFPSAHVPLAFNQVDNSSGAAPSGTPGMVSQVSPSFVAVSDPGVPFADQNGLVAAPNLDPVQMFVQTAIAKYAFTANVNAANADTRMTTSLLDVLR